MYKIGYEELRIFFMNANNCIYTWRNALDIIRLRMGLIVNNDNFKGKAATCVKAYLSDVHIYLIDSIITLLDEYAVKFIMYQNGLYQFDSSETASLDEGEMNDLRDIFNSALTDITDLQEACVTKMNGISDLTDCNLSSLESYTAYLTDSRTELVDYRNAIKE